MKDLILQKLPLILAIVLYVLIYFLRLQQGGWEFKSELFKDQRNSLDERISKLLPSPKAELLSGILLGNNKKLPGKLKLALRDTSTLHIVVASGQNLSMVAGFFLALSGLIKKRVAIILGLLAALLYTLLTGLQVPILRAAIMFGLASIASIFGRQKEGISVLILTGAFMLLLNPLWVYDLSFQLSFLATLGVVGVAPILESRLGWLPKFIRVDLSVTSGAQVMVMPIIIQNFHQLSLVSVITNLSVGWTVPFIMISGSLMLIFGSIFSFLTSIFLTYFINTVSFFSSLPFAWEYVGEKSAIFWVGYYMILASVLLSLTNGQRSNSPRS